MKRKKPAVDWYQVQRTMKRSIRGEAVSEQDSAMLIAAYGLDPARYSALHAEEKARAIAEVRAMFRPPSANKETS